MAGSTLGSSPRARSGHDLGAEFANVFSGFVHAGDVRVIKFRDDACGDPLSVTQLSAIGRSGKAS